MSNSTSEGLLHAFESLVVPFQLDHVEEELLSRMVPESVEVALLGESTHGTEEFYILRQRLTRFLIEKRGFRAVLIEAEWPDVFLLNEFVTQKETVFPSARAALNQVQGSGKHMWQNYVTADMLQWMKEFNAARQYRPDAVVYVFGMDCQQIYRSLHVIYSSLSNLDWSLCTELKARLSFFNGHSDNEYEYSRKTVRQNASEQIPEILQGVLSEFQWEHFEKLKAKLPADRLLEILNIEQNLEVIVNGEEYFRKMQLEPSGSQASWNTRDQHMALTVNRIRERLKMVTNPSVDSSLAGTAKVVAWAHNSHIGSAAATARGGQDFVRNETWNLGQMIKHLTTNSWLLGFDTFSGTVTALVGQRGDGAASGHMTYDLKKAIDDSSEQLCHQISQHLQCQAFLLPLKASGDIIADTEAHDALQKLLAARRPQRYVGIHYVADNELQSHYNEASLLGQYDALVFVDETTALRVLTQAELEADQLQKPAHPTKQKSHLRRSGVRRLMQEYRHVQKHPLPHIRVAFDHDNVYHCHFLLTCDTGDFAGGEYHGRLEFPSEYPMAPPSIFFMTPNGRFEVGERICVSFSDYHPELWNPSWGIESVLIGLQSFMQEECPEALGSIRASRSSRQKLARQSHEFNMKSESYRNLFLESEDEAKESELEEPPESEDDRFCRYCRMSGGELVSPCECKGGNKWVHAECLAKWQYQAILSQSTHPSYQTGLEKICNVCQSEFNVQKFSREGLVLTFTGQEMASMIQAGSLLVATKKSSEHNLRLMEQYADMDPYLCENLAHWTKSVFLITETFKSEGGKKESVMGFNLTHSCDPMRSFLRHSGVVRFLQDAGLGDCKHFIGGPVDAHSPFVLFGIKISAFSSADRLREELGCSLVASFNEADLSIWFARSTEKLSAVMACVRDALVDARVYWGYACWDRVQLLGEIARGAWGLALSLPTVWTNPTENCWTDNVERVVVAGKNDWMSKAYM